ncbi:MAG: uncharacterized protein JWN98_1915 [Abditibacteriota bacterium]|nr:uncharacterized protein [Abditibacteriota bacterium]
MNQPMNQPVDAQGNQAANPSVVMRTGWHDLLFLHWRVHPESLRPLIPAELTIDTFEGWAYVGLVPFAMTRVRPNWLPSPLARFSDCFAETNVRTYVRLRRSSPYDTTLHDTTGHDAQPGVWFWSLDAANLPAVVAARAWFKLPYFWAQMELAHQHAPEQERETIRYSSRRLWPGPRGAGCKVLYRPDGEIEAAREGTLEHFLVERYRLYSQKGRRVYCGRVQHQPYPLQRAKVLFLQENLLQAAGIAPPHEEPLAHYARRVDVDIFSLQPA